MTNMNTEKRSVYRKSRSKLGISGTIVALILIVVGVALAVVVASIAGGFLFGWGTSSKLTVERVDILVNPVTRAASIVADIRNSGGAKLTDLTVEVTGPAGSVSLTCDTTELNPGQTTTCSGTGSGFESGQAYIATATATGPGGTTVKDQKSAIGHI